MTVMGPEREVQDAFEALEPIVDNDGGIKASDVVAQLVRSMSSAKSFDTRIVFLCVVNQTVSSEIKTNFLTNGGWLCIAKWLTIFIDKNQGGGIIEVLKCLQRLPVTINTLKMSVTTAPNDETVKMPGALIRKLRKHDDDTIKKLSIEIYKHWSELHETDNMKKKKKKEEKLKAKKDATKRAGPQLADTLMTNMFEVSEEERNRQKLDKQRRKELKKRKKEEEKAKAAKANDVIADILTNMPQHQGAENADEEENPNSSPPIGRGTPSPELVKRPPKPGAKTVRWMDEASAKPLDYIREFEVDPNERVNVNSEEYKMKMELEAFKEAEVMRNPDKFGFTPERVIHNFGDLAPKRQWRSPRKIAMHLSDTTRNNLSGWSKKSEETVAATERCSRTLQRIYPRASIPDSPSEPEPAPVPSGAQTVPVKIPQFLEESNDPMATQVTPMETTPTVEPSKNVEPPKIDLSSLGINMDTLRDAVSNANGGQHAPPTQPTPDNLYDAPRYSNSPPQDNRFGRVHAPTPPRPHTGPPNRSSSPSNGHRYAPYPNNRRSPPFGRPYDNRRYDDTRNRFDDRYGHGRDDRYPRDRSPVRVSDSRRHSRSPPPRYHSRSSPPRPHYRDSRVGGDRGGYRR